VVDQKGGNNLLYLPLDKLIQATNPGASLPVAPAAPAAAQPDVAPAAPAPSAPAASNNSTRGGGREVTRSRDFGGQ
jgi:membrane protease subunit HflK